MAKQAMNKIGTFNLINKFLGYTARIDSTMVPPGTLVSPSQNVLMNTSGRVASVKGYTLDGASSSVRDSGILSNVDFSNFKGDVRNMRAGFLTSAGNDGKLQYRYVDSSGTINWIDLQTGLSNVRISYAPEYWDNSALVKLLLWVNGSNNIYAWNGAVTELASATSNTVTKSGTKTWAEEGFSATGSISIGGVTATYTGGTTTTTLTGVSVDFSASAAGSIIHQQYVTTALSSMTSILPTFGPTIIGCGRTNQVYLGSSNSNSLYISKVNNYKDYSFSTPTRLVGEGNLIPLDYPPTAFMPLEVHNKTHAYDMYISEGESTWSVLRSVLSSDLASESIERIRLKVAPLAGSQSNRLTTKMKNQIMFVDYSNTAQYLGYTSFQYVPVIQDFSWPIIDDMKSYDFTDGSAFWYRNYAFIAVPKEGLIRIYNMTDQTQESYSSWNPVENVERQPWFWEAPIHYPISGFYTVDGEIYGHSYTTSESYKLFDGGTFNGQNITANATFGFTDLGDRTQSKRSSKLWAEGYIKQNTLLNANIIGDLDTFEAKNTVVYDGSDMTIVAYGGDGNSLGKNPLGSNPLGGSNYISNALFAWFRGIKTYNREPYYLEQISFTSSGPDQQWELLSFGTNATMTTEGNNNITQ